MHDLKELLSPNHEVLAYGSANALSILCQPRILCQVSERHDVAERNDAAARDDRYTQRLFSLRPWREETLESDQAAFLRLLGKLGEFSTMEQRHRILKNETDVRFVVSSFLNDERATDSPTPRIAGKHFCRTSSLQFLPSSTPSLHQSIKHCSR